MIIHFIFLFAFLNREVESAKWVKENIEQSLVSRNCLHPVHLDLFNDIFLYMNDPTTRQELEAIALGELGAQLRTGRPYCQCLVLTTKIMRDYLDLKINRLLHKSATKNDFMANGWLATITYFDSPGRRERCERIIRGIPENDTKADLSVFSETVRCFSRNRKLTTMRLMVAQFREEEEEATV